MASQVNGCWLLTVEHLQEAVPAKNTRQIPVSRFDFPRLLQKKMQVLDKWHSVPVILLSSNARYRACLFRELNLKAAAVLKYIKIQMGKSSLIYFLQNSPVFS